MSSRGTLTAVLARQGDRTVLRRYAATAPLRLFGPLYRDAAGGAQLYLTNTTAGILQGDVLEVDVTLEAGASALLTAPAAQKVFSMRGGGAAQTCRFRLGPGARLVYWPDQVIPFRDCDYRQETEFHLEDGAAVVAADLLSPGRVAYGEAFAFGHLDLRTRFYLNSRLMLADLLQCRPEGEGRDLTVWGRLEGHRYLANIYAAGAGVTRALAEDTAVRVAAAVERSGGRLLAGCSQPWEQGLVVRMLGETLEAVRQGACAIFEYLAACLSANVTPPYDL